MTEISNNTATAAQPSHPPLTVGQTKRALEWWTCSEGFRKLVQEDPERAGKEYDLGFNPELIRLLWDPSFAQQARRENLPVHPAVLEYQAFFKGKTAWRVEVKAECSPDEPRFKAWRNRQVARNALENGGYDDYIIHTPLAIELTDGCSVGCWFCGVGATPVGESIRYTEENAALWRDILSVLRGKIGSAAKWGFLYWATDPLDNPDYEHFALDFSDIIGMFPQTTTAQGHKDPERIRRILKMSEERGCRVNRFSVLTEAFLRRIYAAYTPDELTNVEIVAQMPGTTVAKADAGAFRELAKTKKKVVEVERRKLELLADRVRRLSDDTSTTFAPPPQPGTIACVSGFLLNMVKRTVKLISPTKASDDWPLGYITFDERTFTDAEDLGRHLEEMMEAHMPLSISPDDRMRLNPSFGYTRVESGFRVMTAMNALVFQRQDMADYVGSLGDMISSGEKTAAQIALSAFFQHGVPEINTLATLGAMFEKGILVDAKGTANADHRPTSKERTAGERSPVAQ